MKRIDKIIKILEDAEKDFRLPPDFDKYTRGGLCSYIHCHPLLKSFKRKTKNWYIKTILKNMDCSDFCFTNGRSQWEAWIHKTPGYNTERADWCKMTLEKIQKEGIND